MKRFLLAFLLAPMLHAQGTYTAASDSYTDVNAVINGGTHVAINGDIIQIPCSGIQSVTWTSQLVVTASITITALGGTPNTGTGTFGSGTNCLTIVDDYTGGGPLFKFTPTYAASNNVTTLQNLNIDPLTSGTALYSPIYLIGTATSSGFPQARLDNIVFGKGTQWTESGNSSNANWLIRQANVIGVTDHVMLPSGSQVELYTGNMGSYLGVGSYGDNSWAVADSMGGPNNWFNENNLLNISEVMNDCEIADTIANNGGCRVVNRYNHINATAFDQITAVHGLDTSGRPRSGRHTETYGNTVTCVSGQCIDLAASFRGGTGMVWGNIGLDTHGVTAYTNIMDFTVYRTVFTNTGGFGACGNASSGSTVGAFDTNDGTTYFSGTTTSGSAALVLHDTTQTWTTNQFIPNGAPYSVFDITQNFVAEIASNTATTITIQGNIPEQTNAFSVGDTYQIRRSTVCADQAGRGAGALISGSTPSPSAAINEALDPVYEWNDSAQDLNSSQYSSDTGKIIANRDFYSDNWKGGSLSGPAIQTSATAPFNGSTTCGGSYSCGVGWGTLANRPTTCTTGVAYAEYTGGTTFVQLDKCTSTNTWTNNVYSPYTYPHPLTVPASNQTWFVRADGGTRYDATNVPTGQCNGLADAAYVSGVNQPCAFNDVRYLWDLDARLGGIGTWVIAGGDTVVIRGCHALATQSNPSNPNCRIGWDQNNGGSNNNWCYAVGNQGCYNPPIPAGTSGQHTKILGGCAYGTYTCTPINNGYPYGATNEAQIFGGFGLQYGFNLSNTSYVDVEGLEFTSHNGVCSHGYSPGYPAACNTSTPDDFEDNGLWFAEQTSDVPSHDMFLQDVYIHGVNSSGLFGPTGQNITMNRVFSGFNGFAGFNFNDNSSDPMGAGGTSFVVHYVTMIGNGCIEQYPIVNTSYPALGCWDTNSGGFGDAWSGQSCLYSSSTNCLFSSFVGDHLVSAYNTKDGFIGPHVPFATLSITQSSFYGNMGQQLKYGGNPNSTLLIQNNFIEGNCNRMATALSGAAQNFNQSTALGGSYLTGYCRAGGDVIETLTQIGSVNDYYGNTFIMNGEDGLQFDCGPVGGGSTNCNTVSTVFTDNIMLGYTNPAFGSPSHLYEINAGTNITITSTYNTEFGLTAMDPCGVSGIICALPAFTSQPTTPWPASEASFDNFNFYPGAGSPSIHSGTAVSGLTADYFGVARPSPPSMGAAEPLTGVPQLQLNGHIVFRGTAKLQ